MTAAVTADVTPERVWLPASESLLEWGDDFHELLLADRLRMATYQAAIVSVVRPGMVVVDLGTGTGILAQWALGAGAERVYGIELNQSILTTAVRRISDVGYADRFVPVAGLSTEVELPERADLIMSEILGNIADNEGCVPILQDARDRFLRPEGALLPRRVESYLVPVSAMHAHQEIRSGRQRGTPSDGSLESALRQRGLASGFDLYYDVVLPASTLLAAPRLLRAYTFDPQDSDVYQVRVVYPVHRQGIFTGFKGYFIAELGNGVTLDISGDGVVSGDASPSWRHCYLPIAEPVAVQPHDQIELLFTRNRPRHGDTDRPFRQTYSWSGHVRRDGAVGYSFSHRTARST